VAGLRCGRPRRPRRLEGEVDLAHEALEDRKLAEAFTRIQRSAHNRNLRLADVARAIVEQRDLIQYRRGDGEPSTPPS
jgi:hypothetical protein